MSNLGQPQSASVLRIIAEYRERSDRQSGGLSGVATYCRIIDVSELGKLKMQDRYEILDALPVYGPMYVPVTADGDSFYFSTGFVVRFARSDGSHWVANFMPGWTDFNHIVELKLRSDLLVIAGGAGYLMDPDEAKPLATFGIGYTGSFNASRDRIVLEDITDLTIVEANGTHWRTEQISWDGLRIKAVEGTLVSGVAYDPLYDADEWVDFTYDLDKRTLIGGSYNRQTVKSPWWKFWHRRPV